MATSEDVIARVQQYAAKNYNPIPVVLERGEGVWAWDPEGRRYLDMLGAYSALNHGHRHPRVVRAAHRQIDKIAVVARAYYTEELARLVEYLAKLTGLDRVLPMNSGAEAVETALKVARAWGHRVKGVPLGETTIVVCDNNFHGRTTTIVGFSSEAPYREPFAPATPGFVSIPYGDLGALEAALTDRAVAFLVEPVQGEGGIIVPPEGYLREARRLCTERRALLIADEVQTGLGRTGKLFAVDHEGVKPDLLVLGKALGGGVLPVSACVGRAEALDAVRPGEHGSTFGGSPFAMAVALAALQVVVDDRLPERAAELGDYTLERLRSQGLPGVREVRGRGLLVGVELDPRVGGADRVCHELARRGVLCKGTREHVLRIAPPLIIERAELDPALDTVLDTIDHLTE
jgi:ornithine--oxo-acid transaminase